MAAADRAVAGLAEYGEWRGAADRLVANGPAVLAHPAVRDGGMAGTIARRLDRLSTLLELDDAALAFETLWNEVMARAEAAGTVPYHAEGHDELLRQARALAERPRLPAWLRTAVDETIAHAGTCEGLCAQIRSLRGDTGKLLEERQELEAETGLEPPSMLDAHAGWRDRCEAAARSWEAMQDDPATWRPHLAALKDEVAAIGEAVNRFDALKRHDATWADLRESHKAILEEAEGRNRAPVDLEGWDALVDKARALAQTPDVPVGAKRAAQLVLDEDRLWRGARAEIVEFLDGARPHGEFWETLQREAQRLAGGAEAIPAIDLPSYRPLTTVEQVLRETDERSWTRGRVTNPISRGSRTAGRPSGRRSDGSTRTPCWTAARTRWKSLREPSGTRWAAASGCRPTRRAAARGAPPAASPSGTIWTRRCAIGWRPSWPNRPTARRYGWSFCGSPRRWRRWPANTRTSARRPRARTSRARCSRNGTAGRSAPGRSWTAQPGRFMTPACCAAGRG